MSKNTYGRRENRQRGAAVIEYALEVALISIVVLAAARAIGTTVSTRLQGVGDAVAMSSGSGRGGADEIGGGGGSTTGNGN